MIDLMFPRSGRLVAEDPHDADIVTDALTMAWFRRKPAAGLMHHSDRGRQYASHAFQVKLKGYGMVCTMSRKGNSVGQTPGYAGNHLTAGTMRQPKAGLMVSKTKGCMDCAALRDTGGELR